MSEAIRPHSRGPMSEESINGSYSRRVVEGILGSLSSTMSAQGLGFRV